MKNKENDFCLENPDGRMNNTFESKNVFTNDNKNFVKENNVSEVKEQEYVQERFVEKPKKIRGPTTNLNAVSGFLATTAVAVASTVVIVVSVIVSAIVGAGLYATTSNTLTFYVQPYVSGEEHSYIAMLCDEDGIVEEKLIEEPFVEFYNLKSSVDYTLKIIDVESEDVVFHQNYKTAPQDFYAATFEAWIENNVLTISTFKQQNMQIEGVQSYTISVYDSKGNAFFEKTVETLDGEYTIALSDKALTANSSTADPNGENSGDTAVQPSGDGDGTVVGVNQEEKFYVGIVYQKDDYVIGSIQCVIK